MDVTPLTRPGAEHAAEQARTERVATATPHLPAAGRPVPTGAYRLQLHAGFTFADAAALVEYFDALGVSHLYLSPVLAAAPGSTHGYDVVDHGRVNPELGGEAGLRALAAAARERGLGLVVDVVPNHMAVPCPVTLNAPLTSVLAEGPASPYAHWFDVDWQAQDGRLLMPLLDYGLDTALRAHEISVTPPADGAGRAWLRFGAQRLPLRAGTEHLPLPELLDAQHYRLASWRVAADELNYRRFFDISTLIAIRVEAPDVFAATHRLLLGLIADQTVDGLRVDHPDGLADPRGYLRALAEATGGAWVVAEKILAPDERLPADWPCAGTTGYDTLRVVGGVFVDPAGEASLTETYTAYTAAPGAYSEVTDEARRDTTDQELAAEVSRLVRLLSAICAEEPGFGAESSGRLAAALTELLVSFDVYRAPYVPGEPPSAEACADVERAAARARLRLPAELRPELDLVADLALGRRGPGARHEEFAIRFGQTCGPIAAKGVEDTALYRWHRLIALNEVGGAPDRFGVSVDELHAHCAAIAADWPATMTTLTTHDTKRSEDVRARLAVLSEMPERWARAVSLWRTAAAVHQLPSGRSDPEAQYLLWQTLVGAWPLPADRAIAYMEKATREAKRHTSWTAPDEAYECSVRRLVNGVLTDARLRGRISSFVAELLPHARVVSLGQKLLQLTVPGAPDVYQGGEFELLTLVDPDNRREVDFEARRVALAKLDAGASPADLSEEKLLVTSRALRLRRARPDVFGPGGGYQPLRARGGAGDHLVAFARGHAAVTLATRLPVGLAKAGGWHDTLLALPPGEWEDVLTGVRLRGGDALVADLLAHYPVALLERIG